MANSRASWTFPNECSYLLPVAGLGDNADDRALLSAGLIGLSLVVFFISVFPGNRATANWTETAENWEVLRQSWEYGHAANAFIVFAAVMATARATMGTGGATRGRGSFAIQLKTVSSFAQRLSRAASSQGQCRLEQIPISMHRSRRL